MGIGATAGIFLGVLIARVRLARDLLEPPLLVLGTVPVIIFLPFLLLWFGTARIAQAGLVIFYALLTLTIVSQQAAMNVSGRYQQYALSLGARPRMLLFGVIFPAMVPEVIGGIRVALALGWGFQAIAELIGAQKGAGKVLNSLGNLQATDDMIAILLAIGILAVAVDGAVALGGRWVVRWRE